MTEQITPHILAQMPPRLAILPAEIEREGLVDVMRINGVLLPVGGSIMRREVAVDDAPQQ